MKRGISLVSLVITMIIMVAIVTSITISGTNVINNNKKLSFATEINMLQNATNTYITENGGEIPENGMVALDVSQVSESVYNVQFAGEEKNITGNEIELYKINYSKLGITSLKYGTGSSEDIDVYLISPTTKKVYYAKGLFIGGNVYYTLTDDLKKIIKPVENNSSTDGIVFKVSTTEWTSDSVRTQVIVPKSYQNVVVSVIGSSNVYNSSQYDTNNNVYDINNIDTNYVIKVEYTNSGKPNVAEYVINNVDKEYPQLSLSCVKENIVETSDSTDVYLKLEGCEDSLSGIKEIKYAFSDGFSEDNSKIAEYLISSGLKVYNNIIEVEKPTKSVLIYAEDNAQNYTLLVYELSQNAYNKLLEKEDKFEVTASIIKNDTTQNSDGTTNKYIGKTVEYTGYSENTNNITWKIFGVDYDTNKILLIADNYVNLSYKTAQTGITISNYNIYASDNRDTLINYLKDSEKWSEYAVYGKTTAYGSPTIEQFVYSYKLRHQDKYLIANYYSASSSLEFGSADENIPPYGDANNSVNANGYVLRFSEGTELEKSWLYAKDISATDSLYTIAGASNNCLALIIASPCGARCKLRNAFYE